MLQDKSEDFTETSKFIERRFEDLGVVVTTLSLSKDFTAGLSAFYQYIRRVDTILVTFLSLLDLFNRLCVLL